MKVYLVILEDRHADVQVQVFKDKQAALNEANEYVAAYLERYGEVEEQDDCPDEWLMTATLSSEGDCVRVEEAEII